MNIMSIIDKIYESKNFSTVFMITVLVLAVLFIVILIMGLRDAKKAREPKKETREEDVKDISFELPSKEEKDEIKEDVTFELPVLTDNLESFKKNIEEELEKEEEEIKITRTINDKKLENNTRPLKILDVSEIEDTTIIETIDENRIAEIEKAKKEEEKQVAARRIGPKKEEPKKVEPKVQPKIEPKKTVPETPRVVVKDLRGSMPAKKVEEVSSKSKYNSKDSF